MLRRRCAGSRGGGRRDGREGWEGDGMRGGGGGGDQPK